MFLKKKYSSLKAEHEALKSSILIDNAFTKFKALNYAASDYSFLLTNDSIKKTDSLYLKYQKYAECFNDSGRDEFSPVVSFGFDAMGKIDNNTITDIENLTKRIKIKLEGLNASTADFFDYETENFFNRMFNQPCSKQFLCDEYLTKDTKLLDCIKKLEKAAINLSDKNKIRYFNIGNDGLGIITDEMECDKNGCLIKSNGESFLATLVSSGDEFHKRYMISIEKNNKAKKIEKALDLKEIEEAYENYCKPKWTDINEIKELVKAEAHFNEEYSLIVKIFIYKKHRQGEKIIELVKNLPDELIAETRKTILNSK